MTQTNNAYYDAYEESFVNEEPSSNDSTLHQLVDSLGLAYRTDIIFIRNHVHNYYEEEDFIRIEPSSYKCQSVKYNVLIGDVTNNKILINIGGYNKCGIRKRFEVIQYYVQNNDYRIEFINPQQVKSFILAHTRD